MTGKIRGRISGILVAVLIGMAIFPNSVLATDGLDGANQINASETSIEDEGDTGDIQENGDDGDDALGADGQELQLGNEQGFEEAKNQGAGENQEPDDGAIASQGLVNFVGVEFPYLETPQEQKLFVSFGDGTENISEAKLVCEKSDGSILELNFSEKENEVYLFKYTFEDSDTGAYSLAEFHYVQEGVERTVGLREIGIDAQFGVNEYYPGYEETLVSDTGISVAAIEDVEDIEASIVNVEPDAIENAEVDIEEAIEETVDDIETGKSASKEPDDIFTKATNTLLSSMADIIMPKTTAKAAENVVVVLDPGHGGSQPGAGAYGLIEKDINLKIAKYCKEELEQYNGVTVHMTRESDETVGLTERVRRAKNWGADVLVSLHINSGSSTAHGAEVYYPNSSYNQTIHNDGKNLADSIYQKLIALGLDGKRGIKFRDSDNGGTYEDGSIADYYTIICDSKENGFPGIIVEHAFISNASDAAKLAQDSFLRQLGAADAAGIANFFNLSKGANIEIENKNDFNGTAQIKAVGLGRKAVVKVWNDTNSDPKTYPIDEGRGTIKFNISDFKNVRGQYYVEAYSESGVSLCKKSFYMVKDPSYSLEVEAMDQKSIQYQLKVQFAEMPSEVKGVRFAVWSDLNGQDDVIWYQADKKDGKWIATADVRKHKTAGHYTIHAYAAMSNGSSIFLDASGFTVEKPEMSVVADNYNVEAGTFDVTLKEVKSVPGITKVEVPVWCAENQSDIYWYTAQKQSDGSYKVKVNIANHKYSTGLYKIHSYTTMENGVRAFSGSAQSMAVTLPEMGLSAVDDGKETIYTLKASNVSGLGLVKEVRFAVWSDLNGQDDIIWYPGTKQSNGIWTAKADVRKHKTAGHYNVHTYAVLANGSLKFIGATEFTVNKPQTSITVSEYRVSEGTFDVDLTVQSASGVSKVEVPIWCAANQNDIRWYEAKKQSDGSYRVSVNIANHKYATGAYKIHVYVTSGNGVKAFAGSAPDKMVTLPEMEITATDTDKKETSYNLEVTNVSGIGVVKEVRFATWSDQNGQDDIIWYPGTRRANNTWTAIADIKKHRTPGHYNVHVYATLANGNLKYLGSTGFTVSKGTVSSITIQDYDDITGSFRVNILDPNAVSGISKVEVPVWCAENQSDIKWYNAVKAEDGNYYVDVDPINHKDHSGLYKIHVYITAQNGIKAYAKSTSLQVSPEKYLIMGDTTTTVDQMVKYYESSNKEYPAIELGKGGAFTLKEFCQIYYEEAEAEGVRAEVAFTQAMKETGWLQYGGIVKISQFNFAGIGALDGNAQGECASFKDVRTGIRAQIQHLKAYGCKEPLKNEVVDPRFDKVKRGCAPYVEYLGQKENPEGLGWATAANYGKQIVSMIKVLKAM